ncbi:ROK family transcriptional regulator [Isoptericola sediminis]|uniref:ROK family transcriptional regulator n=1 Tax=Isoptericola sediminis TaxID=2733572 RepID=A0A849K4G7_9MICO|nr:ROK family transcriptional regulator [Isoptericola sediminis]NNU27731.1 ROK family transcriptional regulator [Isoptericola sediminis]
MKQSSDRADAHRSAVLARIGARGPMSRADLARELAVSPALVTQTTKRLLADGLLVELQTTPSTGGRPARLLGLATTSGAAVGVKVVAGHVTVIEAGIDGTVLRSVTDPFDATAPTAVGELVEILRRFVATSRHDPLLGIGVGIPGSVDAQATGTVDSTQLGWQHVPLGDILRRELAMPVLVENNVNALTMAERLFGQARGHDDVLVVTIGTGVGAGIVSDGVVLRGATGSVGEFGHLPVVPDGPVCQCGAHGCLEALVGEHAIVRDAVRRGLLEQDGTITDLQALADDGDEGARDLFATAGALLGRALAGAVNLLDPEIVVVLGEGVTAWPYWAAGFEPALRSAVIPRKRGIVVAVETWQDDRWAQGAASLVLSTPFDAQGRSGEQGRLVRERMNVSSRTEQAEVAR